MDMWAIGVCAGTSESPLARKPLHRASFVVRLCKISLALPHALCLKTMQSMAVLIAVRTVLAYVNDLAVVVDAEGRRSATLTTAHKPVGSWVSYSS